MPERILVIAHDRCLRESRVEVLQRAGYRVESVESCDDAIALLEVRRFDLVLLGRKSRQSKEGIAQRLRAKYPDLLILKIGTDIEGEGLYASRITDPSPKGVLTALHEMLDRTK